MTGTSHSNQGQYLAALGYTPLMSSIQWGITQPETYLQQIFRNDLLLLLKQLVNIPCRTEQSPVQPHPLLLAQPHAKRTT